MNISRNELQLLEPILTNQSILTTNQKPMYLKEELNNNFIFIVFKTTFV